MQKIMDQLAMRELVKEHGVHMCYVLVVSVCMVPPFFLPKSPPFNFCSFSFAAKSSRCELLSGSHGGAMVIGCGLLTWHQT